MPGIQAKRVEYMGRRGVVLGNDLVRAVVETAGGMVPEFGVRRGAAVLNAHWGPDFRDMSGTPFSEAAHGKYWKVKLLHMLAGDFPCSPSFGPPCELDGIAHPAHGWAANEDWTIEGVGVDEAARAAAPPAKDDRTAALDDQIQSAARARLRPVPQAPLRPRRRGPPRPLVPLAQDLEARRRPLRRRDRQRRPEALPSDRAPVVAFDAPGHGSSDRTLCSLPEIAYLCPESQCAKNQRNGPCGGSHAGTCEVGDKQCIWVRAYDRLKPYGEEAKMLKRPPVVKNGNLQGTSSWANRFLDRDHNKKD